jgi:hypothetical protein
MKKPASSKPPAQPQADIAIERIHLDAQGYDASGAYYGIGQPVFLVAWPDGASQAVRAPSLADARDLAQTMHADTIARAAEWQAGAPQREAKVAAVKRARAERTTTYRTNWVHPLTRQTHQLSIRHTRDYLGQGDDHIEIRSTDGKSPHPLSETGYRSEFIKALALINAGGVVTFVDALVAKAIVDRQWLAAETRKAQGDLFKWADAQAEVGRKPTKPKAPAAAPAKRRRARPDRAPE